MARTINGGRIEYTIGYKVDTESLKSLQGSLQQLRNDAKQKLKIDISTGGDIQKQRAEIEKTIKVTNRLEEMLEKAYNPQLKTYSITKFNAELNKSEQELREIKQVLSSAGATGQAVIDNLNKKMSQTTYQVASANNMFTQMGKTLKNTLVWNISSSVINTFTGKFSEAYGYVRNLDSSLNDIRIVTGKSADEMQRFAEVANKAAKNLGKGTTDYTEASLIYYQQGLGDEDVKARTDVTLKAANVTQQSTSTVSEQLTAVWNGYKVSAQEAELYIDKLAAVAANTASDLEELSTGMSKVASAANLVGVDIDQMNAMLATTISVTRQAPESVGTAYKTILARMTTIQAGGETEDGADLTGYTQKMNEFGINVLDNQGYLREMGEVIEEVGTKWSSMSKEAQISLAQVMAGTRQYNNLTALFDNWDMYKKALQTSADAAGTLNTQNEIFMESTEAHLQQMRTAAEGVFDSLLDADSINKIANAMTKILGTIEKMIDAAGGLKNMLLPIGSIVMSLFSSKIGKAFGDAAGMMYSNKTFKERQRELDTQIQATEAMGGDASRYREKSALLVTAKQRGYSQEEYEKLDKAIDDRYDKDLKIQRTEEVVKKNEEAYDKSTGIKNISQELANNEDHLMTTTIQELPMTSEKFQKMSIDEQVSFLDGKIEMYNNLPPEQMTDQMKQMKARYEEMRERYKDIEPELDAEDEQEESKQEEKEEKEEPKQEEKEEPKQEEKEEPKQEESKQEENISISDLDPILQKRLTLLLEDLPEDGKKNFLNQTAEEYLAQNQGQIKNISDIATPEDQEKLKQLFPKIFGDSAEEFVTTQEQDQLDQIDQAVENNGQRLANAIQKVIDPSVEYLEGKAGENGGEEQSKDQKQKNEPQKVRATREFNSIREAAAATGINSGTITHILNGDRSVPKSRTDNIKFERVATEGGDSGKNAAQRIRVTQDFDSMREASRQTGVNSGDISRVVRGEREQAKGAKFERIVEKEEEQQNTEQQEALNENIQNLGETVKELNEQTQEQAEQEEKAEESEKTETQTENKEPVSEEVESVAESVENSINDALESAANLVNSESPASENDGGGDSEESSESAEDIEDIREDVDNIAKSQSGEENSGEVQPEQQQKDDKDEDDSGEHYEITAEDVRKNSADIDSIAPLVEETDQRAREIIQNNQTKQENDKEVVEQNSEKVKAAISNQIEGLKAGVEGLAQTAAAVTGIIASVKSFGAAINVVTDDTKSLSEKIPEVVSIVGGSISTLLMNFSVLSNGLLSFKKMIDLVSVGSKGTVLGDALGNAGTAFKNSKVVTAATKGLSGLVTKLLPIIMQAIPILAILAAVTAAVFAVSAIIDAQVKKNREAAQKDLEAAQKDFEKAKELETKANESAESFKASLEQFIALENNLKDLVSGTEEYNQKLKEQQGIINQLIEKYPELKKLGTYTIDGWKIEKEDLNKFYSKLEEEQKQAKINRMNAEAAVAQASIVAQYGQAYNTMTNNKGHIANNSLAAQNTAKKYLGEIQRIDSEKNGLDDFSKDVAQVLKDLKDSSKTYKQKEESAREIQEKYGLDKDFGFVRTSQRDARMDANIGDMKAYFQKLQSSLEIAPNTLEEIASQTEILRAINTNICLLQNNEQYNGLIKEQYGAIDENISNSIKQGFAIVDGRAKTDRLQAYSTYFSELSPTQAEKIANNLALTKGLVAEGESFTIEQDKESGNRVVKVNDELRGIITTTEIEQERNAKYDEAAQWALDQMAANPDSGKDMNTYIAEYFTNEGYTFLLDKKGNLIDDLPQQLELLYQLGEIAKFNPKLAKEEILSFETEEESALYSQLLSEAENQDTNIMSLTKDEIEQMGNIIKKVKDSPEKFENSLGDNTVEDLEQQLKIIQDTAKDIQTSPTTRKGQSLMNDWLKAGGDELSLEQQQAFANKIKAAEDEGGDALANLIYQFAKTGDVIEIIGIDFKKKFDDATEKIIEGMGLSVDEFIGMAKRLKALHPELEGVSEEELARVYATADKRVELKEKGPEFFDSAKSANGTNGEGDQALREITRWAKDRFGEAITEQFVLDNIELLQNFINTGLDENGELANAVNTFKSKNFKEIFNSKESKKHGEEIDAEIQQQVDNLITKLDFSEKQKKLIYAEFGYVWDEQKKTWVQNTAMASSVLVSNVFKGTDSSHSQELTLEQLQEMGIDPNLRGIMKQQEDGTYLVPMSIILSAEMVDTETKTSADSLIKGNPKVETEKYSYSYSAWDNLIAAKEKELSRLEKQAEDLTNDALIKNLEKRKQLYEEIEEVRRREIAANAAELQKLKAQAVADGAEIDDETGYILNDYGDQTGVERKESWDNYISALEKKISLEEDSLELLEQMADIQAEIAIEEVMQPLEEYSRAVDIANEQLDKFNDLMSDDAAFDERIANLTEINKLERQQIANLDEQIEGYKKAHADYNKLLAENGIGLTLTGNTAFDEGNIKDAISSYTAQIAENEEKLKTATGEQREEIENQNDSLMISLALLKQIAELWPDIADGAASATVEKQKYVDSTTTSQNELDELSEWKTHTQDKTIEGLDRQLSRLRSQESRLSGSELTANLNKQKSLIQQQIKAEQQKLRVLKEELKARQNMLRISLAQLSVDTKISIQYNKDGSVDLTNLYEQFESNASTLGDEERNAIISYVNEINSIVGNITSIEDALLGKEQDLLDMEDKIKESIENAAKEAMDKALEIFNAKVDFEVNIESAWREFDKLEARIKGLTEKTSDLFEQAVIEFQSAVKYVTANPNSYFGDVGGGSVQILTQHVNDIAREISIMQSGGTSSLYGTDQTKAFGDLSNYYGQLSSAVNGFYDQIQAVRDKYAQAIDDMISKTNELLGDYDQMNKLQDSGINLTKLLFGEESFDKQADYLENKIDISTRKLKDAVEIRKYYEQLLSTLNPEDENYDKVKSAYVEAMNNVFEQAEANLKLFQEKLNNAIDAQEQRIKELAAAQKDFNSVKQQDRDWDYVSKVDEDYLDATNTEYGITSLTNKFNNAIDSTDSLAAKKKLNDVMKEQLDILDEQLAAGQKLTKYDIDRANKVYELTLKQIALEEAQANKSKMRLRRDSQGNYRYEYIADQDKINKARQDLLDAENDLYNFDKNRSKELLKEIQELYTTYWETFKAISEDASLTEEQKAEELLKLQEEYWGESGLITMAKNEYLDAMENTKKESVDNFSAYDKALGASLAQNWGQITGEVDAASKKLLEELKAHAENTKTTVDISTEGTGVLKDAVMESTNAMAELVAQDELLIGMYAQELMAIQELVAQLDVLENKYRSVMDAALAAIDAALRLRQTSWETEEKEEEQKSSSVVDGSKGATTIISNNSKKGNNYKTKKVRKITAWMDQSGYKLAYKKSEYDSLSAEDRADFDEFLKKNAGRVSDSFHEQSKVNEEVYRFNIGDTILAKKKGYIAFDTGGYTGEWGNEGRIAMLHQKELILNKVDTANILQAVDIVRGINSDLSRLQNSFGGVAAIQPRGKDVLEQNVKIEATFPNVSSSAEIEAALSNLVNMASQRVMRNRI